MLRYRTKVSVFAVALAVIHARADVVPISISQSANASGGVSICNFNSSTICGEGSVEQLFNLSSGNTKLPPQTLSQSGSASASLGEFDLSAEASTGHSSSVSASSISLTSGAFGFLSGFGVHLQGAAIASSQYLLVFDLTSQSIAHLTGSLQADDVTHGNFGFVSSNAHLDLTGQGFQFERMAILSGEESFDMLVTLAPGMYTLDASTDINDGVFHALSDGGRPGSMSSMSQLSLNADFVPVPEPSWLAIVPALLVVAGCCATQRVLKKNSYLRNSAGSGRLG